MQQKVEEPLPTEEALTLPWPEPGVWISTRLPGVPQAPPTHPKQGISDQSPVPNFLTCALRKVNPKPFASADVAHLGAFPSEHAAGCQAGRQAGTNTQQGSPGPILCP